MFVCNVSNGLEVRDANKWILNCFNKDQLCFIVNQRSLGMVDC